MPDDTYEPSRAERLLVTLTAACIGLSVLCFIAIVVVTGVMRIPGEGALWNIVVTLPLIGLPFGFALFAALLVVNFMRRRRHTSDRA
jgi:hypothetical protein